MSTKPGQLQDARNGRIGLTDSTSNRTTVFDPDQAYQVSAVYLPTIADGTKEHQTLYSYDSTHRLTGITQQLCTISSGHACSSTTATGSDTYAYDDSDNRTRVAENNGNASSDYRYCYDARNQLTGRGSTTACDTSSVETFAYDDPGNRTQAVEAGTTRNFAYTAEGLLCDQETGAAASCSGGNVTSDDAGRISDQGGWHYVYDAKARLVSACHSSACTGTGFDRLDFEYDGEGHRTKITTTPASGSAAVYTFRYQGDAIAAEYKDGTLTREYTLDSSGTISKVTVPGGQTGAGTYLVTWNGHGDALALYRIETNGTLTLANSYTYGTWGTPTTSTHNSIADLGFRFLYVGAADVQWDSAYGLDLLYMHARHYSPNLGRFLQPDPSRLDAKLFAYAGNGPPTSIDATGECSAAVATAANPTFGLGIEGIGCILEGAGRAIGAVGGVALFIVSMPFLVSSDTIPPKAMTRPIARVIPRISPNRRCFAIGEDQARVIRFSTQHSCAWMPTFPPFLQTLLPRKVKMFINGVWMLTQMMQLKHLYDLGPRNLDYITSPYYQMERIYAAVYPWKTTLWGWGL